MLSTQTLFLKKAATSHLLFYALTTICAQKPRQSLLYLLVVCVCAQGENCQHCSRFAFFPLFYKCSGGGEGLICELFMPQ